MVKDPAPIRIPIVRYNTYVTTKLTLSLDPAVITPAKTLRQATGRLDIGHGGNLLGCGLTACGRSENAAGPKAIAGRAQGRGPGRLPASSRTRSTNEACPNRYQRRPRRAPGTQTASGRKRRRFGTPSSPAASRVTWRLTRSPPSIICLGKQLGARPRKKSDRKPAAGVSPSQRWTETCSATHCSTKTQDFEDAVATAAAQAAGCEAIVSRHPKEVRVRDCRC